MAYVRTQIYLEPRQHRALKEEAHRRGVSLAHLLRQVTDEILAQRQPRGDLSALVGIGASGSSDVTHNKDEYLAQAIAADDAPSAARTAASSQP
jgi:hypothetical protein